MALVNASSAGSILGVNSAQVRQLVKAGILKDRKEHDPKKSKHFGLFDVDQVLRLHEKHPDVGKLMRLTYKTRVYSGRPRAKAADIIALELIPTMQRIEEKLTQVLEGLSALAEVALEKATEPK